MSTKSLVDRLAPFCKGWSRTGTKSILSLIQQGQDKMFDYDAPYMIYRGTDNEGFPPYLTVTSASTYKYELTAANLTNISSLTRDIGGTARTVRAKKPLRVFIDLSENDYDKRWVGQPFLYHHPNPYSTATTRIYCGRVPVTSAPALQNTPAWIMFDEAPDVSTEKYFVEFTWEPPRLVSENIPLVVPEDYEDALEYYVIGKVQMFSNGKPNDMLALYEARKLEFQTYFADSGANDDNLEVAPVNC